MPTILCIDDQPAGLAIRKQLLETKGYKVLTATDGAAGIALARREKVDVVVLDYRLPEMDGEQIAAVLKAELPALPIVLLTGYPGEIPNSLRCSVDACVEKGSGATVLLAAIQAAISAAGQPRPDRVRPHPKRDSA